MFGEKQRNQGISFNFKQLLSSWIMLNISKYSKFRKLSFFPWSNLTVVQTICFRRTLLSTDTQQLGLEGRNGPYKYSGLPVVIGEVRSHWGRECYPSYARIRLRISAFVRLLVVPTVVWMYWMCCSLRNGATLEISHGALNTRWTEWKRTSPKKHYRC